jgi:hypothetical protein
MPYWVSMARAMSVARIRSLAAPVLTSPKVSFSATRPPKSTSIRAWSSDWLIR